tara:strand:+ start:267 stop:1394 length:1128 start_codon:yes stop_codon:yes gene_type:complete
MDNKNFEIYFDCGLSNIRGVAINKKDIKNSFSHENKYFFNHSNLDSKIQNVINLLEKNTNEYLDEVNLIIDSSQMISIGISVIKKLDGSKLKKDDVLFLIKDIKQQISRNYPEQIITHIIIKKYKINDIDYTFLPSEISCDLISVDIEFICLPKKMINYFRNQFFKLNISVKKIYCSSYVKSYNYHKSLSLVENSIFIDMGFNKTSILNYTKEGFFSLEAFPIGGKHITQDLSKVLDLNLSDAEELKLSFDQDGNFLKKNKISTKLIEKIILSRIEEILDYCIKPLKRINTFAQETPSRIFFMGEGSRILNKKFQKIITNLDLDKVKVSVMDEKLKDISNSVVILHSQPNKQEAVIVPKKQINEGFFERLFHLFN